MLCISNNSYFVNVKQNAKRASEAAAPLASWVTSNIKYAAIIEKIEPLETEQAQLQRYSFSDNMPQHILIFN